MTEKKKALITGITGQIGSYLAELLIEKGYEVYGLVRDISEKDENDVLRHVKKIYGDFENLDSIEMAIRDVEPDEIYNLAAQSDVQVSYNVPEYTLKVNGFSVIRICETVRKINKPIKIYQAGSAEFYGNNESGQEADEDTPFNPVNSYAVGKLLAFYVNRNYRESYGMFCCNGILFNTESPRRGENFVTRKISMKVAEISKNGQGVLKLGNLNARRDWSHAKDSARAMWMIMQAEKPDDYVIASGESHSIREFVEKAFGEVDIEIGWRGEGIHEVGFDKKTNKVLVEVDPKYFRAKDRNLVGNPKKAREILGWKSDYSIQEIVKEMVREDLAKI
jgi:GDPmannose 4,6-dehydratase